MSKLAKALATAKPARMGAPSKLDQLDDDDVKMIVQKYQEGMSVMSIANALTNAGFSITANPIIKLLRRQGVYRGG